MKKIFKGIAVLAATAAIGTGVAFAAGCGSDGVYEGSYSYTSWGQTYGMSVKVTVKNNIITKVEDTTAELHAEWHPVSPGWEDKYVADGGDTSPSAVYTIVTKSKDAVKGALGTEVNWRPVEFTFKIAVGEDGKIRSFEIVKNGSADGQGVPSETWASRMPESFLDGSWFVGKTSADIVAAFGGNIGYDTDRAGGNINTGIGSNELVASASQSTCICLHAAAFASANAKDAFGGKKISALKEYADIIDLSNSSVAIEQATIPSAPDWYKWTNAQAEYWTKTKAYLLQQYEGLTVKEVLGIKVYIKDSGEPYEVKDDHNIERNPQLAESGLLVTGATQGSGRLMLAVQDALSKK